MAKKNLIRKTTKSVESNNNPKEERTSKKMAKPQMTPNFIVEPGSCRLLRGSSKVARAAVKAQPAVPEKKDEEGNIIQKAVPAVAAKPATSASFKMAISCDTEEIAQEVIARMADQGLEEMYQGQVQKEVIKGKEHCVITFVAENQRIIRDAFKKAKSKDDYNAAGLKAQAEEKKAAAKAKKAEEKEAAKKSAADSERKKANTAKKAAAKKPAKKSAPVDDDEDGWPEA